MNPANARAFVARLEDETFASAKRDALIQDIRAGVYRQNGGLGDPFTSLRLALVCIDAPQSLIDYMESLRPAPAPSVGGDVEIPEEALAAARAWQMPDISHNDGLATIADAAVELLVPSESNFMRALQAEDAARVAKKQ